LAQKIAAVTEVDVSLLAHKFANSSQAADVDEWDHFSRMKPGWAHQIVNATDVAAWTHQLANATHVAGSSVALNLGVGLHTLKETGRRGVVGPAHGNPFMHVVERPDGGHGRYVYYQPRHMKDPDSDPGASPDDVLWDRSRVDPGLPFRSLVEYSAGTALVGCAAFMTPLALAGLCVSRAWVRPFAIVKPVELKASHDRGCVDAKALSIWDGTVATFSSICGTGLLAMPYAFSVAGLIGGTVAILLFVGCSAYTANLMVRVLGPKAKAAKDSGLKVEFLGWPFLVEAAFGRKAKYAISVFLAVELWGYLLSVIITSALNMNQFSETITVPSAIMVSVVVAYAFNMLPTHLLTRLNVISNFSYIACLGMFLATGLMLPERAPTSEIGLVKPRGLLSAAGILVFSPAAHSFYPDIMQRMEEPQEYFVCVRRAYLAAGALYLTIAVLGYCLFGGSIQPSAVKNIGVDLHLNPISGLGWMNTAAAVGMTVKMLAMQPLILSPLTATIEGFAADYGPLAKMAKGGSFGHVAASVVLALSAVVSLRLASEMAVVMNFIGSVFCMTIAFIVPVLCYWKLAEETISKSKRLVFICLLVAGGFFALTAIIAAI
jgi:amino acid permease